MEKQGKTPEEIVAQAALEAQSLVKSALMRLAEASAEVNKFKSHAGRRNASLNIGDSMNALLQVVHRGPLSRTANCAVYQSVIDDNDIEAVDAVEEAKKKLTW